MCFAEKHLFLDSDHSLFVWAVGVEFETHLCLNGYLETCLSDEFFKVIPVSFRNGSIVQDYSLKLNLFILCAVELRGFVCKFTFKLKFFENWLQGPFGRT